MRKKEFKVGDLVVWDRNVVTQPPGIILKVSSAGQSLVCFPDTGIRRWCTAGLLHELTRTLQEKG